MGCTRNTGGIPHPTSMGSAKGRSPSERSGDQCGLSQRTSPGCLGCPAAPTPESTADTCAQPVSHESGQRVLTYCALLSTRNPASSGASTRRCGRGAGAGPVLGQCRASAGPVPCLIVTGDGRGAIEAEDAAAAVRHGCDDVRDAADDGCVRIGSNRSTHTHTLTHTHTHSLSPPSLPPLSLSPLSGTAA